MSQPRAFVSRMMHPDAIALIGEATEMEVWPDDPPPAPEMLRSRLADTEGVLINIMDRVDTALLDAAPKLRVISQLAAGLDNVDFPECTRRGILLGSTPGILSKAGRRPRIRPPAFGRAPSRRKRQSSTLGIVGLGQIGLEMARRARGFDMRILYHSRNRRPDAEEEYGLSYATLDDLLTQQDALRKMKSTAILVNISRGPVVDTDAICTALREGWIAGAGLDVVDPEPIPDDHPLLFLDNVTITPHIGSASVLSRRAMSIMAAQNLINGLNGQRLVHCANPELYERRYLKQLHRQSQCGRQDLVGHTAHPPSGQAGPPMACHGDEGARFFTSLFYNPTDRIPVRYRCIDIETCAPQTSSGTVQIFNRLCFPNAGRLDPPAGGVKRLRNGRAIGLYRME
ncbi:Glyoxylate reductase [Geodia barretti]|uniref:Glyoxylate reductase n=1 Tax=Geodia barretti TaxID=519541 RepID=A0AA35SJ34_GEOBA|nr:Glyoxylate reductase [Geodia barretti]